MPGRWTHAVFDNPRVRRQCGRARRRFSPRNEPVNERRRDRDRSGQRRGQCRLSARRPRRPGHRARGRRPGRRDVRGELRVDELVQQDAAGLSRPQYRGHGRAPGARAGARGRRLAPAGGRHRLGRGAGRAGALEGDGRAARELGLSRRAHLPAARRAPSSRICTSRRTWTRWSTRRARATWRSCRSSAPCSPTPCASAPACWRASA